MRNGATPLVSLPAVQAHDRGTVIICVVAVLAIVLAFGETAMSIVRIWQSSETYSHGYFVVPIALWLVWRNRAELAQVPVQPCWPGLLLVAAAGFLWLLGSLADANVVQHFALAFIIQAALLVILGVRMTRALLFPLLFLLFAVPFGEAFVPKLMDWTADFTVLALKLTGVPVYREGNNFVIPSGRWSVVEACSGIRYLIASLLAGVLYAHLMYRSAWRRALFVTAAILVPIVANWVRAYAIVMIGHLSANELATGVDHLIYGWVFFGMVLFAMFWVGARFREDTAVPVTAAARAGFAEPNRGLPLRAALAVVVLAVAWPPLTAAMLAVDAERQRILPRIEAAGGWKAVQPEPVSAWQPHYSGQRTHLRQTFERGGKRVAVSIYYYAAQTQGRELINSDNVLVTTKDPMWRAVGGGWTEFGANADRMRAKTVKLAGPSGRLDVVWWYWIDGQTTTSDTVAKGLLAWSRLRLRSDDSAAVFLSTDPASENGGTELLQQFASDMEQSIQRALSVAREGAR